MHHIPVMLNGKCRLANQVFGEACDSRCCGLDVTLYSSLSPSNDVIVGLNANEQELSDM
jgi:hypothetical protein